MINEFFGKVTETVANNVENTDLGTIGKIVGGVLAGAGVIALIGAGIHHAKMTPEVVDDVPVSDNNVAEVEETPVEVVEHSDN